MQDFIEVTCKRKRLRFKNFSEIEYKLCNIFFQDNHKKNEVIDEKRQNSPQTLPSERSSGSSVRNKRTFTRKENIDSVSLMFI